MFAVEPGCSTDQNNTRSSLRNLLRSRDHHTPSTSYFPRYPEQNSYSNEDTRTLQVEDFGIKTESSENQVLDEAADCLDNPDFNYSQKLFHIDDGNLYSVFSPIQGRSYGMRPSFLRKQKYTVQECHTRGGRKGHRKGLKFHNFLPAESLPLESLSSKWKVRSECRLKEEHGTKQITLSNWSQHADAELNVPDEPNNHMLETPLPINFDHHSGNLLDHPFPFNVKVSKNIQQDHPLRGSSSPTATCTSTKPSSAVKKETLSSVLSSLLDKSNVQNDMHNSLQMYKTQDAHTGSPVHRHRRKPEQTRRVVPYAKYLSIMEEDETKEEGETPLDLSNRISEKLESPHPLTELGPMAQSQASILLPSNSNFLAINPSPLAALLQSHITTPLMIVPTAATTGMQQPHFKQLIAGVQKFEQFATGVPKFEQLSTGVPKFEQLATGVSKFEQLAAGIPKFEQLAKGSPKIEQLATNVLKFEQLTAGVPKFEHLAAGAPKFEQLSTGVSQFEQHAYPTASGSYRPSPLMHQRQKRSQRSVIKQKLEDTFKQNGFLVKTKQVSDGDATFCKFRQLRKYTRYYLKSWQQHLPDEVHKMWKGFLPPKTMLPSSAESPSDAAEETSTS